MTQQPRLDKSGRVLIPKKLRDELSPKAGQAVTLEVDGDGLHLRPVARAARLVEHRGRAGSGGSGQSGRQRND